MRIAGVIADVTVTQHYRNEGQRAIEARYVFPGSTASAVYAMNVRLGDRLLTAKIREKQQARIEYETAKQEGKTTALLEQHRPNVFEMNVANILPGDEVAVELRYTELLTPRDAVYGFVFPDRRRPALQLAAGRRRRREVGLDAASPGRRAEPVGVRDQGHARHAGAGEGDRLALARGAHRAAATAARPR